MRSDGKYPHGKILVLSYMCHVGASTHVAWSPHWLRPIYCVPEQEGWLRIWSGGMIKRAVLLVSRIRPFIHTIRNCIEKEEKEGERGGEGERSLCLMLMIRYRKPWPVGSQCPFLPHDVMTSINGVLIGNPSAISCLAQRIIIVIQMGNGASALGNCNLTHLILS